jgi:peptidase E
MKRQIFAMGGGGFSMEPENPLLDDYILNLEEKSNPKIAFIATASGDAQDYIDRFYASFETKKCTPSHLSLFKGNQLALEDFILSQDIVYVGGGNTRSMLRLWKKWGLDTILKNAYQKGVILSGLSAGAICWFEEGLTDSIPGALSKLDCLGFLKGSNCPHFDGEVARQEAYKAKIVLGEMKPGIACDDGVGLHYVNEKLEAIVSSRAKGLAYEYSFKEETLLELVLNPRRLTKNLIK